MKENLWDQSSLMLSAVNAYFFDIFYHFFAIFQNEMGFIPGDFLDTLRCEIPNSHIYRFNGALYVSDISFLHWALHVLHIFTLE